MHHYYLQHIDGFYFDPRQVAAILKTQKPSSSLPFDGTPPILYKECCDTLSTLLAYLFNIALMLGEVPQTWKHAMIRAIPKKTIALR